MNIQVSDFPRLRGDAVSVIALIWIEFYIVICWQNSLSPAISLVLDPVMFGKVVKPNNGTPDELEKSIGEALLDLEVNSDLKTQLRELYITGAKELDVGDKKKCLIIFVPVPLLKQFQKIQVPIWKLFGCFYCY